MSEARVLAAGSIIATNYLAQLITLADSYFRHHPDGRFFATVVDGLPGDVALDPRISLVPFDELAGEDRASLTMRYGVQELCSASKPRLLEHLLHRHGVDAVVLIDADSLILRPLSEIAEALQRSSIVLIPHLIDPIPLDGHRPAELDILLAGAFGGGLVSVARHPETQRFLAWWRERAGEQGTLEPQKGTLGCQRWLDLVPGMFAGVEVLRHPGYNVGHWALSGHSIERHGNGFTIDGQPIATVHFSGFDPDHPTEISRFQDRVRITPGTALAALHSDYAATLYAHGYATHSRRSYGYGQFSDGVPVSFHLRRLYHQLGPRQRGGLGDPWCIQRRSTFRAWATEPIPEWGYLTPLALHLHSERADLAGAFPDVAGRDREAYVAWLRDAEPECAAGCEPRAAAADQPDMDDLRRTMASYAEGIADLRQRVADRERELAEQSTQMARLRAELAATQRQQEQLGHTRDRLEAELASLKRSPTWRVAGRIWQLRQWARRLSRR
ncbi:MAG: hypothetical protein U0821_11805 [Chloroflexota bacterium]